MGMFDYIKFECDLPEAIEPYKNQEWQTKSLDCHMDEYVVGKEGQLFKDIYDYIEVPEKDRMFYGKPEWDKGILYQLAGARKAVFSNSQKSNYTGEVESHSWDKSTQKMSRFVSVFVHGKLSEFIVDDNIIKF